MNAPETPDWVRDAVFVQIFPDRFAKSGSVPKPSGIKPWGDPPTNHGYQGGDLIGVLEHLDYLTDLGVNAIYFTPIFQSASNHRYHTHDYEKVDPMLGGTEALGRLLKETKKRGMRVVLDGVFNHASRGFLPFNDILENGKDSAYLDWFTIHGFPVHAYDGQKPNYAAWWGIPALPKFNVKCPEAREFLLDIGRRWIEFGIDGWRLDVANEIDDDDFWREFRRRVREADPQAYIVGEVWDDAQRWLKGDMWDAVMNYQFTRACIGYFIGDSIDEPLLKKTSLFPAGAAGAPAFAAGIEQLLARYRPEINAVMLNLLSSHDMARFLTMARGDRSAVRLATLFQMSYLGAPSIYYGDEIGLPGAHDPDNRRAFPWHAPETWDYDLLNDFKRYIALRHERASLRRGEYRPLLAKQGVHVHARVLGEDVVIVALNADRSRRRVDVPVAGLLSEGAVLRQAWAPNAVKVDSGKIASVDLPPREGRVFLSEIRR